MTGRVIRSLILKRLDELDRFHADDPADPEKIIANEHRVVYEVAECMARAGYPRLHSAGLALLAHRKANKAKSYLSLCLKALRQKRPAGSNVACAVSEMLTPPQVAKRYGVSPNTVRSWCPHLAGRQRGSRQTPGQGSRASRSPQESGRPAPNEGRSEGSATASPPAREISLTVTRFSSSR